MCALECTVWVTKVCTIYEDSPNGPDSFVKLRHSFDGRETPTFTFNLNFDEW